MTSIARNYRSILLLVDLNMDRLLMVGAMLCSLMLGGLIGAML